MVITTISSAAGSLQQGSLRPLAVTTSQRSPALPDVATLAEQFILARRALNSLSDRYLKTYRGQYFGAPAEG